MRPESHDEPVDVCVTLSRFFHLTTPPREIVMVAGRNAKPRILTRAIPPRTVVTRTPSGGSDRRAACATFEITRTSETTAGTSIRVIRFIGRPLHVGSDGLSRHPTNGTIARI